MRGVASNDYPSHCAESFSIRLRGDGARDAGVVEQRASFWNA